MLVLSLFLILVLVTIWILVFAKSIKDYKESSYYQITKSPYLSVKHDLGKWGEYLTYRNLKKYEEAGAKFLFNVYIPKQNGETTEIDVLMISKKGVFVFESKNYSGWIFGKEEQKNWYQTLPAGKGKSHKEHFYNPIMQNRSHIKHLKELTGEELSMYSIIVFSERCTLKNIEVKSSDVSVVHRNEVALAVLNVWKKKEKDVLSQKEIAALYSRLYPLTQCGEEVKRQHIANIQGKRTGKPSAAATQTKLGAENELLKERSVQAMASRREKTVQTRTTTQGESMQTDAIKEKEHRCPKCGGALILRTAGKGANAGKRFWGCSNYPKCRYIMAVKESFR